MAKFYETSGAWKEITTKLEAIHLKANHPRDIETLLESCLQEYEQQLRRALEMQDDEIVLMEQVIAQEKSKTQHDLADYTEKFSLDIKQAEVTLDFYQHDHNIFKVIRNPLRIRRESWKLQNLQKTVQDYREEIEKPLRSKEAELENKKAARDQAARGHCREIISQIEFLKTLSGSQELANAQAELEMLQFLQNLPDTVHVINHINLKVDRGFRSQGKWLIRAQIDNLVISPAGLFAIEVKNWSKQFPEKKTAISPSEQIKDAAQLCYMLLKPDFPGITVRPILAYHGHLPESENTGFVKVLPIQEVCGYINWFTETSLDKKRVDEIVKNMQALNQPNSE